MGGDRDLNGWGLPGGTSAPHRWGETIPAGLLRDWDVNRDRGGDPCTFGWWPERYPPSYRLRRRWLDGDSNLGGCCTAAGQREHPASGWLLRWDGDNHLRWLRLPRFSPR